jgi:predicted lipoprotein with Yx(FWY)xxD motif
MKFTAALTLATAALLGACATFADPAAVKVSNGLLTGANGMTLYTFDKDTAGSGKSVCNGPCATNWPPLMATDTDKAQGDYSVVTRDDGKPLYFWIKDTKAGDTTGEGFMNVWHTVKLPHPMPAPAPGGSAY